MLISGRFQLEGDTRHDKLVRRHRGRFAHRAAWPRCCISSGRPAKAGLLRCANIATLQKEARLIKITQAGFRESHVHDVVITKEAPNYRSE